MPIRTESETPRGPFAFWTGLPLYLRILIGLVLGLAVGIAFGPAAKRLDWPARMVLRVLGALAPALILVAVVHAIMTAAVEGKVALRLFGLLALNTLVAF